MGPFPVQTRHTVTLSDIGLGFSVVREQRRDGSANENVHGNLHGEGINYGLGLLVAVRVGWRQYGFGYDLSYYQMLPNIGFLGLRLHTI